MNTAIQDTIERTIVVNAPKERVYSAIADPTQIVKWFPDGIEGSLDAGSRPVLDFGEYGKAEIFVVAADPNDYFAYRWTPGGCASVASGDVLERPNTLVEFRLEEVEGGTQVRLIESGFASLPPEVYEQSLKENNSGWDYMLDRFEKLFGGA